MISKTIIKAFKSGNKLMVGGCGGLAAESLHFCGELVGKFQKERKPLPALALGSNLAVLTAISNDYSFEDAYAREVEAFGLVGDLLVIMSTSGKSKILLRAIDKAREMGIEVIEWPRYNGNGGTAKIQEKQLKLIHKVSEEIENYFYARQTISKKSHSLEQGIERDSSISKNRNKNRTTSISKNSIQERPAKSKKRIKKSRLDKSNFISKRNDPKKLEGRRGWLSRFTWLGKKT